VAGTGQRAPDTEEPIVGFGSLPRKEDARFIGGRGTYLDDIRRPGMLHGAILRSPLAHARIVSIDASAALALPKGARGARAGCVRHPRRPRCPGAGVAEPRLRLGGRRRRGDGRRVRAMRGRIAATHDGRILAVSVNVVAEHGAFNATAQPSRYPAGFFGVFTGSYELEAARCRVTGAYTNKAPGGGAYSCSFRIAEALDLAGYDDLRREQAEKRDRGELMGIGVSFFTEAVGAGPRKHMDMFGLAMNDGAALRVSPTGTAQLAISVQSQGQGHETTFAQIVAEELGIPPADVDVVHGDTDATPYGLGTYGSRSTPVSGAATALVARKVRERARLVAAAMLEAAPDDLEWTRGRWSVKGDPEQGASIREIAMAARGAIALPDGVEAGLDAEVVYDPPNLTFPFGAYLCVVDADPGTAEVTVRRFLAVDDCGARINPMIVEDQVHGGLTDGVGMALMEQIAFDEDGNCLGGSLMDYLSRRRSRSATGRRTSR